MLPYCNYCKTKVKEKIMIKIAFVCHGNICRSPMAEFVFKKMISERGIAHNFHVESLATSDEEIWQGVGNPIHQGTLGIFKKYNIPYDTNKRAVQLTSGDYDRYDLFIGMDRANVRNMNYILGTDAEKKIKLLLDYTGKCQEVADPWYTGNFEVTYTDIERGCEALLESLGVK